MSGFRQSQSVVQFLQVQRGRADGVAEPVQFWVVLVLSQGLLETLLGSVKLFARDSFLRTLAQLPCLLADFLFLDSAKQGLRKLELSERESR